MDISIRRIGNSLSYCQSCGDGLKGHGKYIVKDENKTIKVLCIKCCQSPRPFGRGLSVTTR